MSPRNEEPLSSSLSGPKADGTDGPPLVPNATESGSQRGSRDEPPEGGGPKSPPTVATPANPQVKPENHRENKTESGGIKASEVRRLFSSAPAYAEALLWIRNKGGGEIPLRWNPVQQYIQAEKRRLAAEGRPLRFLLPKARRLGVTTQEQALSFALCATRKGQQAATLADTREKSKRIFRMASLFYDRLPPELQPYRRHENRTVLNFERLGSSFFIGTAGSTSFGRGDTLQRVHGSEVAYWLTNRDQDEVDQLIVGLTEASSHGEVVLESTANGNSGWWYDAVTESVAGGNEWSTVFVPWFVDPNLRIAIHGEDELAEVIESLDDREKWLTTEHGLDAEQIKWRRTKRNERAMRYLFPQEYPEVLEESFLASTLCHFNHEALNDANANSKEPIRVEGALTVWAEPQPDATYTIGADPAEGVQGGDFSAAGVIHNETGEQVARLHLRCRPEEFARRLGDLGTRYNHALVGCERESIGHAVITTLYNVVRYPNLYFERQINDRRKATRRIGWSTNGLTRPILLDDLRVAVEEGEIQINDRGFLRECRTFEQNNRGKYEARSGHHDDLVMCWGIAWQVRARGIKQAKVVII